jgi:hypothetical protein
MVRKSLSNKGESMYQVKRSVDQGFYYLLKVDKDGNQTFITQEDDLKTLLERPELKGVDISVTDDKEPENV